MSSCTLVVTLLLCLCLQFGHAVPPSLVPAWAWIGGSKTMYDPGVYGVKGVPSPFNHPGARYGAALSYDSVRQEFWLFGGYGSDGVSSIGFLNDLWRYRVNDSTWTWISGNNTVGQTRGVQGVYGVYGVKGIPSPTNYPGGRREAVGWFDSLRQEFWLFGGAVSFFDNLNDLWRYRVSDSTWTWMSGSNATNQKGVYGTKGNASIENVPGARSGAVGWFDSSRQELWLFGGSDSGANLGRFNDLWRYRVNDNTWTWISGNDTVDQPGVYGEKGVPSSDNQPSARDSATGCYDNIAQEFWLFGGRATSNTILQAIVNDLWRYRINDSTWTWISGSNTTNNLNGVYGEKGVPNITNVPSGRAQAIGWCDGAAKELWIFGGSRVGAAYLNDLWRFNMNDSTWTWMSGSNKQNNRGVVDTNQKGVPSVDFMPSSRVSAAGWYDINTKEIWLFSGEAKQGYTNDLWRYRMNDSTWTWISGSDSNYKLGVYGEKGNSSTSNIPGGREGATSWYDCSSQELWVFGGTGYETLRGSESATKQGKLNDLWRYRVNDSTWTWVSGSNIVNQPGIYGVKGIPNSNNQPGAREGALGLYDSLRQVLWLFGGYDYDNTSEGYLNDLWRYDVNNNTWTWVSGSNQKDHRGVYGEMGNASSDYFPSARSDAVGWFDISANELWLFGGVHDNDTFPIHEKQEILNDMWRYRVNDSTWTWVSGSKIANQPGFYGEKGIPRPNNHPGARGGAVGWYDSLRQEFWLFGGYAKRQLNMACFNDLWRYRMNDSTWTWMSGSNATNQKGVYGTKGNASIENVPASRYGAVGWFNSSAQELWLFGGSASEVISDGGDKLNDLWRYRMNDSTWTWMGGSSGPNQFGVYGEKGILGADNNPGSRSNALSFYDSSTLTFMLFGGSGFDAVSTNKLNDMWMMSWVEKCPLHHQLINSTCIPFIDCSSANSNSDECTFKCGETNTSTSALTGAAEQIPCLIDEDVIVNGSILENPTVAIVGVVNVTGDVRITGNVTVKILVGAELNVGRCLTLEDDSVVVIVVGSDEGVITNGSVVLSYDSSCSSQNLLNRVNIESTLVDECRDGKPTLVEQSEGGEGGRARLELVFLPVDADECKSESDLVVIAIAVAVPVGVVLIVLVVILAVPPVRKKVLHGTEICSK